MKTRTTVKRSKESYSKQSGSALITVIIFSFVIGALSLSYLKMASTEHRASMRSTTYASCLNLAESGVEMAILGLNSGSSSNYVRQEFFSGPSFSGDVQYVVLDSSGASPTIYAEGYMNNNTMDTVSKQVRVELSSGFQPYLKGFAARDGITFNGNGVLLDSYNSNYGDYDTNLPFTYTDANGDIQDVPSDYGVGGKNKSDDVYVASALIGAEDAAGVEVAITVGNADVYGYVQTGANTKVSIKENNGFVQSYDGSSEGRILGDFSADFPVTTQPSGSYDQTYNTRQGINNDTVLVGSNYSDNPIYYDVSSYTKGILEISGHAILVMGGDIKISGQSGIILNANSSVKIYTENDVDLAGQGLVNTGGKAADFEVIGTAAMNGDAAGQDISITGQGVLAASVYAPNATVKVGGNGGAVGAVVGLTATIGGNGAFHFDEALREIIDGGGTYSIDSWMEMTGSNRVDLSPYFADDV